MLYIWIISLIFYRYTFFTMQPSDLAPPYWINMGAMAISTLAGTLLVAAAPHSPLLQQICCRSSRGSRSCSGRRRPGGSRCWSFSASGATSTAAFRCATIRSTGAPSSRSGCTPWHGTAGTGHRDARPPGDSPRVRVRRGGGLGRGARRDDRRVLRWPRRAPAPGPQPYLTNPASSSMPPIDPAVTDRAARSTRPSRGRTARPDAWRERSRCRTQDRRQDSIRRSPSRSARGAPGSGARAASSLDPHEAERRFENHRYVGGADRSRPR